MENPNRFYTKSDHITALRCEKALYLSVHHPELSDSSSISSYVIENGKTFELAVRELIAPGGINISSKGVSLDAMIKRTQKELKKKSTVLYQASFLSPEGEFIMCDVIIKENGKMHLIEIKSSSELTDIHAFDTSFQREIMIKSGYKLDKISIAIVNKKYIKEVDITSDIFLMKDVTQVIEQMQFSTLKDINYFKKILRKPEIPDKEIGSHCLSPQPCPFKKHCWKDLPTDNIFEIKSMRITKKLNLYYKGVTEMKQLIEKCPQMLSEQQHIQVKCAIENNIVMQPDLLKSWIEKTNLNIGIYFLDFETIAPVIPIYDGNSPFTQVPVQFSLHYRSNTGALTHAEFLSDPHAEIDQRKEFIEDLIQHLSVDRNAPIVVFNRSFEAGRLKELKEVFPEYEIEINAIVSRIEDLMLVFKEKWYYDPRFKGSYSIKSILQVLCPELSYQGLTVSNGNDAMLAYMKLSLTSSEEDAEKIRQSLLEYCCLDTLAMVKILEFLENINEKIMIQNV